MTAQDDVRWQQQKGLLAVGWLPEVGPPPGLAAARAALARGGPSTTYEAPGLHVEVVRPGPRDVVRTPEDDLLVLLSQGPRTSAGDLSDADIVGLLGDGWEIGTASTVEAPFAAAYRSSRGGPLVLATDSLGMRHVYQCRGATWAALSTSAAVLRTCLGSGLDMQGVAVGSLLGWQVGLRTVFEGVSKLPPSSCTHLHEGTLEVSTYALPVVQRPASLAAAVRAAALGLRTQVEQLLDEHPDTVLQLTGGQDSRLLLAAVPHARRAGLRAMTLAVPGSSDVPLARRIAEREGLQHEVVAMTGLHELSPEQAHAWCVQAARRLDCQSDPLAAAGLMVAESGRVSERRLAGLGGEVVRGFYYLGPTRARPVTAGRVERLSGWRLFPNDAVPVDFLDPDFASWSRNWTKDELLRVLRDTGLTWDEATDEFYVTQRMHRWAGSLATASCLDRVVHNPMLSADFLALGRSLPASWKANSLFLSRIMVELDAGLAALPMDGRPPPAAYAHRGARRQLRAAVTLGVRAARKVRQRAGLVRRPPAGGDQLAALLVRHWQDAPAVLEEVSRLGVLDPRALEQVLVGARSAPPALVSLLVNLEVALAR